MSIASENTQKIELDVCVRTFRRIKILVTALAIALVILSGVFAWIAYSFFEVQKLCGNVPSQTIYKLMLLDIYHYYGIALRDIQSAYDLLIANNYSQYLVFPYNLRWVLEGMWRKPLSYINDSINVLDSILEQIKIIQWTPEYIDEVLQLQQYILELKSLAIQLQEIASKDYYTQDDLVKARSIVDKFVLYNDKIYELIAKAP